MFAVAAKTKSVIQKCSDLFHALYNWMIKCAEHPQAVWLLAFFSFLESSCFPVPPDVLLIPMMLAKPKRAFFYAGVCTVCSIIGGYFGYLIGMLLYDAVAVPILNFYGYMEKMEAFKQIYNAYGAWFVAAAGFTPFPYKVITITSGMMDLNLAVFTLASVLSRGARFFLLAVLLWKWGAPMEKFIEKNLGWLATLFFLLLVGGFALIKYL